MTLAPENKGETLTRDFLNESVLNGLKYQVPDISELNHVYLTNNMVVLLDRYMDKSMVNFQVTTN